jgi:hypothetical protein
LVKFEQFGPCTHEWFAKEIITVTCPGVQVASSSEKGWIMTSKVVLPSIGSVYHATTNDGVGWNLNWVIVFIVYAMMYLIELMFCVFAVLSLLLTLMKRWLLLTKLPMPQTPPSIIVCFCNNFLFSVKWFVYFMYTPRKSSAKTSSSPDSESPAFPSPQQLIQKHLLWLFWGVWDQFHKWRNAE